MKVPGVQTPRPALATQPMPDPMMFVMAAAIMQEYGKLDDFREPVHRRIKRDTEMWRDIEDRSVGAPVDEPLTRNNDQVPGNKGLLGQWNRRT